MLESISVIHKDEVHLFKAFAASFRAHEVNEEYRTDARAELPEPNCPACALNGDTS
jgi:hypothetical protein